MKFAIFGFIFLVSIAATCALDGWLESSANMIECLNQFFQPGAGTIIFSPILLLFIAVGLGGFIGVTLFTVTIAAIVGGYLLRSRSVTVSCSFSRSFVIVGTICQFVFILFALEQNAPFLLDRPRLHPNVYLVAFMAAASAALSLLVVAVIIRKQTNKTNPPPVP